MDVFLTGFPKRLVVAVSIVILAAMCLMPTEAATIQHRTRHQRRAENMPLQTNSIQNRTIDTKGSMNKIVRLIRNTKRFFLEQKKDLKQLLNCSGNPYWLPKVNFVDIHFHDYEMQRGRQSYHKRRFLFLIPKLYKSFMESRDMFIHLLKSDMMNIPDEETMRYTERRKNFIRRNIRDIDRIVTQIKDTMMGRMPLPKIQKHHNVFERQGGATELYLNDCLAFRSYENMLVNWLSEIKCPYNRLNKTHGRCLSYEHRLIRRREERNHRNKKHG